MSRSNTPSAPASPPVRVARMILVFAGALALNLATAAPTVMEGDGAELQTVAALGGIAHPTGYPTWTLGARLFARTWPGEPARRATALSAVAGAAALVALLRILERVRADPGTAMAGVVLVATGVTFRWASIYPEVYAVAILLFLVALETTLAAGQRPTPGRVFVASSLLSLAVTAHFLFVAAAAVVGFYLTVRIARAPAASARHLAAMALGILVGILPYLYTAWADAAGLPMNYLRLVVVPEAGMFGLTPERFGAPWERIGWLVFGAKSTLYPYFLHPRLLAFNTLDALAQEFLFEAGPAALLLASLGAFTLARSSPGVGLMMAFTGGVSFLFAASVADGRLMLPFLLPCTLVLGILGALGAARLASAIAPRAGAAAVLAVAIATAAALVPHAIRVTAEGEPIGPRRWHHQVEGGPPIRGLLPRLDREWAPRRTGERLMALIPKGALVIARWRELTTLYYLRDVEGRRRDLELDPVYRGHESRYARWQETHDLRERPFVVAGRNPEVESYLARRDSVAVAPGLRLYIQREPMRGLPGR